MILLVDVCYALFIVPLENVCDHALIECVDEACTTVMPSQHVLCDDLALLKENDQVEVLWTDGSKLWARFIVAGNSFSLFEIMRILVYLLLGSKTYCTAEEDRLLDEDEESSGTEDYLGDLEDEADKENQVKEKPVSKKRKQKADKGEFILRTGKQPLRNIPLNVRLQDIVY